MERQKIRLVEPEEQPRELETKVKSLETMIFGLLLVLCTFTGYHVGTQMHQARERSPAHASQEKWVLDHPDVYLGNRNDDSDGDYLKILVQHHLQDRGQKIAAAFPPSEIGRALGQILTLLNFKGQSGSYEGKKLQDQLRLVESQPRDSLETIQNGLRILTPEFSAEKHYLLALVQSLDLDPQSKIDFLVGVMMEEFPKKETRAEAVMAFAQLLKLEVDTEVLDQALKQTFTLETSYSDKLLLISLYEIRYPGQALRIEETFGI